MIPAHELTTVETPEPSRGDLELSDLWRRRFDALGVRKSYEQANGLDGAGQLMDGKSATPNGYPPEASHDKFDLPKPGNLETREEITFYALQEWEGYVTEIGAEVFVAQLVDITAGEWIETEKVELPISDLTDEDRRRLRSGSVFRWAIGYQRTRGSKRRVSQIVFRDRPKWTKREIERAEVKAKAVLSKIKWE